MFRSKPKKKKQFHKKNVLQAIITLRRHLIRFLLTATIEMEMNSEN